MEIKEKENEAKMLSILNTGILHAWIYIYNLCSETVNPQTNF